MCLGLQCTPEMINRLVDWQKMNGAQKYRLNEVPKVQQYFEWDSVRTWRFPSWHSTRCSFTLLPHVLVMWVDLYLAKMITSLFMESTNDLDSHCFCFRACWVLPFLPVFPGCDIWSSNLCSSFLSPQVLLSTWHFMVLVLAYTLSTLGTIPEQCPCWHQNLSAGF